MGLPIFMVGEFSQDESQWEDHRHDSPNAGSTNPGYGDLPSKVPTPIPQVFQDFIEGPGTQECPEDLESRPVDDEFLSTKRALTPNNSLTIPPHFLQGHTGQGGSSIIAARLAHPDRIRPQGHPRTMGRRPNPFGLPFRAGGSGGQSGAITPSAGRATRALLPCAARFAEGFYFPAAFTAKRLRNRAGST